jgi:hypothetical protein
MPASTSNSIMAATITASASTVTVGVDAYLSGGLRKLASYDGFVVGGAGEGRSCFRTRTLRPRTQP